jgi:hypothetical protein
LNNIQTTTGQNITISNFISVLSLAGNFPSNVTCTACEQAAYNIVAQQQPTLASSAQSALQSKCGANFTSQYEYHLYLAVLTHYHRWYSTNWHY